MADREENSQLVPPPPIPNDLESGDREENSQFVPPQIFCRICYEYDGMDFISPCKCKGTSKYVHRECLDQWRSVKEGFAFCHCTTCKAPFYLRVEAGTNSSNWRTLKFRFFVTRDMLFIFVAVQLIVSALAYTMYIFDSHNQFWLFMKWGFNHEIVFYYTCGALLFFAMVGLSGCCITCCDESIRNDPSQPCTELCYWCCQPGMHGGTSRNYYLMNQETDCVFCCGPCVCPECNTSDTDKCGYILLIFALVIVVVFALIGIFYSVLVATMVGQRIWQRHYHILAKRILTKEYVVENVEDDGRDWCPPPLLPEHMEQLKALGLLQLTEEDHVPTPTPTPSMPPCDPLVISNEIIPLKFYHG